ncbi:MAG TPA: hypothetical protein DCW90_17520 [Lachnospiraceae bacterium]|nr:hypothetical protein [Lachnospiraceae bacterium]
MKQINIWGYLKLDSFGVEIPFSKSKTEFINYFRKNNIPMDIPTEMQMVVKSKLLSLNVDFFISFQFSGERLISITMSPNTALEGKTLDFRYKKIQKALENELGHPHNWLGTIMNLVDPDNRSSYWQKDGIKIEHYLLNRFGMEEIINIKL